MADKLNKVITSDISKGIPAGPLQPAPGSGSRGIPASTLQPVPTSKPASGGTGNTSGGSGSGNNSNSGKSNGK